MSGDRGVRVVAPNALNNLLLPWPSVMASPPTVTVGAGNGSSSISGSTIRDAVNLNSKPGFQWLGSKPIFGTFDTFTNAADSGYITSSTPPRRLAFEFETDADQFEVRLVPKDSSAAKYRLWVDGQFVTADPQSAVPSPVAPFYLLVNFGSRANRRIRVETAYCELVGLYAHPTCTFWGSCRPIGPKVVVIGDSFGEGTGSAWWWDSWEMWAGRLLGWNIIPSAVGGTGYTYDGGGGGKVKFEDRFTADVVPIDPDIVMFSGGINDKDRVTGAQLQAAAESLFNACATQLPSAKRICVGLFPSQGVTSSNSWTVARDALKAAAVDHEMLFVDPVGYPNTTSWVSGNGKVGATNSSGNADYYTSNDGTHPSPDGHKYLGRRVAAELTSLIPSAA